MKRNKHKKFIRPKYFYLYLSILLIVFVAGIFLAFKWTVPNYVTDKPDEIVHYEDARDVLSDVKEPEVVLNVSESFETCQFSPSIEMLDNVKNITPIFMVFGALIFILQVFGLIDTRVTFGGLIGAIVVLIVFTQVFGTLSSAMTETLCTTNSTVLPLNDGTGLSWSVLPFVVLIGFICVFITLLRFD